MPFLNLGLCKVFSLVVQQKRRNIHFTGSSIDVLFDSIQIRFLNKGEKALHHGSIITANNLRHKLVLAFFDVCFYRFI